jgi:outer membrane protein assembly factor BamB
MKPRTWKRFAVALVCTLSVAPVVSAGEAEEALWEAARQGDLATIKRLVVEGLDFDVKTRYGATALSFASDKGQVDVVRYLVELGADVNVQDTFYESTPIGWATFNEHVEIIEVLLAHGATGADQVLSGGVRSNNKAVVAAALEGSDLTPEMVMQALAQARQTEGAEEIVALLENVDIEIPQREEILIDASVLENYAGKYKNELIGLDVEVRVENGRLVAQPTGQPLLNLRALSESRFEVVEAPDVKVSFSEGDGPAEQVVVEQAGQTFAFPRVVEAAATTAEPEVVAEAAETTEAPAPSAIPIERLAALNWPSFRGPHASGIADGQGAPTAWDVESGDNVLWKTPIPGMANSSPIVWGNRVFVTTAISSDADDTFRTGLYGDVDSVEDLSEHTFKVYALDRKSGEIVWERTAGEAAPGAKRHMKSTQANSTPVTDGKRVCALFGTIGLLACYDVKGKPLWTADLGVLDAGWFYDPSYQWGHASSPVIHEGLVIVQADIYKDSFIAAWKLKNGKQVWKTPREDIPSWGTPTVYRGKKRDELITNGVTIRGYDPDTGKELWALGPNSEVTVATPVVADDLFYVTGGYAPVRPIYAIRAGGNGDLTLPEDTPSSEAVAWSHDRGGTYMPTPIVYGDILYTCANDGRLTAYHATTGERIYRQRIGGGTYTASPIAADGKLYFTTEEGDVVVARAGPEYEELARNSMNEVCMSTPAISDGVMIVRTLKHVYGLGEQEDPASAGGVKD